MSTAAIAPELVLPRSERKKTARKVFEIDDGAPQQGKRKRKPAALGPKAAASASAEDPELACDQSWANGRHSQASLEVLERAIDLVPNMRAAPSFLGTNSQAHPNPFSPIADLMDNGIEAGASEMRISLHKLRGEPMLTMTDDGRGMTERALLDGPLSLCYTSKHGTHYGMGATTSIPAISGFCLLFSVSAGGHRTLGFLSSKLSAKVQASQTKMPQCTWTAAGADGTSALLATKGADAPLGIDARRASLQVILEFSPYATEAALLEVFASMPNPNPNPTLAPTLALTLTLIRSSPACRATARASSCGTSQRASISRTRPRTTCATLRRRLTATRTRPRSARSWR